MREQLETATFKMLGWNDGDEHVHLTYEVGGMPFAHNDLLCNRQGLITPAGAEKLISGSQCLYNAPIESQLEDIQPIGDEQRRGAAWNDLWYRGRREQNIVSITKGRL
ncbi:unnamed protein product [Gongylonema pulchrum]|uniref:Peptidase M12A domain-containing protein n=1 Tax=Gongylonema pulchrum TaxID=637853 RepID=A0A183D577_9BILA|nr:unnamed protein product [Gongylonema pulchrum]